MSLLSLLFFNKGDIFPMICSSNINAKEPASSGSVSCDDITKSHPCVQLCVASSVPQSRACTVSYPETLILVYLTFVYVKDGMDLFWTSSLALEAMD